MLSSIRFHAVRQTGFIEFLYRFFEVDSHKLTVDMHLTWQLSLLTYTG